MRQEKYYRKLWIWLILGTILSLIIHAATLMLLPAPTLSAPTSAVSLIQQGRTYYQTGQFQNAATVLEQAAQMQGPSALNRALALSYLALTYQQLGTQQQAEVALAESLAIVPATGGNPEQRQVRSQLLNTEGRLQLAWGQTEAAVASWQAAEQDYRSLDDQEGVIGTQLNQVQALRLLGLYRRAQQQTAAITASLAAQPDSPLKAIHLRSLGEILRVVGDLDAARTALETSLQMAETLQSPQDSAAALLSLGNVEQSLASRQPRLPSATASSPFDLLYCTQAEITDEAQAHYRKALDYYQQSAAQALAHDTQLQAELNQLTVQLQLGQSFAADTLDRIPQQLAQLALSRPKIYAAIHFAKTLACLNPTRPAPMDATTTAAIRQLELAVQQAEELNDDRAHSYALGSLGQLQEYLNQTEAKQNTNRALNLAQQIQANDIAYQWQWQMGRLFAKAGDRTQSISFYQAAFEQLQALRSDLVALNTDVQFSFRESVEPVYRQLVDLLLQAPNQTQLAQARTVIEALQLAELDNFFRDACSDAEPALIDQVAELQDPTAAVLYPIILPDRLEVILKLPDQPQLQHYAADVPATAVRSTLAQLRHDLPEPFTIQTLKQPANQVYQWLIQPIESQLTDKNVKTLVFVLDGLLRNIPMAILYDGERYLIQKYAVALAPGLQLLSPKPLQQLQTNALVGGLTEARLDFAALPNVMTELAAVEANVPTSTQLLDRDFIEANIASTIQTTPVSIVHLATHGRFSSQAENTFILAYDDRINISELETLLQRREQQDTPADIELLVLSACETATGDERAALGLAGVAVRAGARSTLASLWKADDQATARLIGEFYRRLYSHSNNDGAIRSKAIALQAAQLVLLNDQQFQHPRYWAPFVLLGNWL